MFGRHFGEGSILDTFLCRPLQNKNVKMWPISVFSGERVPRRLIFLRRWCSYKTFSSPTIIGVARGGPGVPVTPPFVSLLVSKQLTTFRWQSDEYPLYESVWPPPPPLWKILATPMRRQSPASLRSSTRLNFAGGQCVPFRSAAYENQALIDVVLGVAIVVL